MKWKVEKTKNTVLLQVLVLEQELSQARSLIEPLEMQLFEAREAMLLKEVSRDRSDGLR